MSEPFSESFASLLTADLCTNTDAFLTVYRDGVSKSSDSIAALTRFSVVSLTANKSNQFLQHELISVSVKDQQTEQLYNFFIERNPSKVKVQPSTLPPLSLIIPSTTSTHEVESRARESSEIPLLQLSTASESVSSLLHPIRPYRSKSHYSLRERFSLTSTQVLRSSTTSFDSVAEDRILGRGMFLNDGVSREIGLVVSQVLPIGLSLFELGILVDVIHNEDPHYSLLKSQCYWFLNTILEVVGILFQDNLQDAPNDLGPTDYLPNLAGHFMNLLIIEPNGDSLHEIAKKFIDRRDKEFSKVCVFTFFDSFISNYLKGTR